MKALKQWFNKIKNIIMTLINWLKGVIMNVNEERVAINDRKFEFYEFIFTEIKNSIKYIINDRRLCCALGISLLTLAIIPPKDEINK